MKPSILYTAIAHFFMILFIYTGLAKLMDVNSFKLELASSTFLASMAGLFSWGLPIIELMLVVVLLVPAWRLKGLYSSLTLMSLFTIYLLFIYFNGGQVSCSCGGIIENLRPGQHLFFNFACIILACIGILSARHNEDPIPSRFKWITTSLSLLLFSSVGWAILTAAKAPNVDKSGKEGNILPSFNMLMMDSATLLSSNNIPIGKSFILIEFSPYCPHCQKEIGDILQNIKRFQDTHIYLVSTFPIPDIRAFYTKFSLAKYPNITVGMDNSNTILKYFNWHAIPFTTIYNSQKKLARAIYGRADVSVLSQCISD